jgi:hypothetical protein
MDFQLGDIVRVNGAGGKLTVGAVLSLRNQAGNLTIRTATGVLNVPPDQAVIHDLSGINVGDTVQLMGYEGTGEVIDVSPEGVTVIDQSQRKLGPLGAKHVLPLQGEARVEHIIDTLLGGV